MHNFRLQEGFREAKALTKKFAKTFYLASLVLPSGKKYASYAIYALCRLSDETVDDVTNLAPQESLAILQQKISLAYGSTQINTPLLIAFRHTLNSYRIPKEYFDELLAGMRMDLTQNRFMNFAALYEYCYRVAGVVGLIMLKVFGSTDASAPAYAIKLGVAMQLTNILRDINEDLTRNRVYLPQDELLKFRVSEEQLFRRQNNADFKELMRFQIKRARQFYAEGLTGIKLINSRIARLATLAMAENYRQILISVEKNDFDVFAKRARVNKLKQLFTVFRVLLEGKYL